jgi:hypothetical protein
LQDEEFGDQRLQYTGRVDRGNRRYRQHREWLLHRDELDRDNRDAEYFPRHRNRWRSAQQHHWWNDGGRAQSHLRQRAHRRLDSRQRTTTNVVEGNYIGLNAAGTAALPNAYAGVEIFGGATSNTIGSSTNAGGRNVISGNSAQGVAIADAGSNSNKVPGNIIGLNPPGTAAIGNQFEGIAIFGGASSNIIGGTTNASPNIISGNLGSGISISGAGTKTNKVQHNFIGTNLNGTAAFPNNAGVQIFGGATGNMIGGTSVPVRYVIPGNNYQGVAISGTGTKSNTVAGNFIGTNNLGAAALPNTAAGASIFLRAQANIIGGATAASRNVISGNLNQGVTLSDSGTKINQIVSNYIGLKPEAPPPFRTRGAASTSSPEPLPIPSGLSAKET